MKKYNHGQIDENEFKILKKKFDYFAFQLTERSINWTSQTSEEFLRTLPLFQFFTTEEINEIISKEEAFQKGDFIVKVDFANFEYALNFC